MYSPIGATRNDKKRDRAKKRDPYLKKETRRISITEKKNNQHIKNKTKTKTKNNPPPKKNIRIYSRENQWK